MMRGVLWTFYTRYLCEKKVYADCEFLKFIYLESKIFCNNKIFYNAIVYVKKTDIERKYKKYYLGNE